MGFDFGAALTAGGGVGPALQQAKDDEFARKQREIQAQQTTALNNLALQRGQAQNQREQQMWTPMRSYQGKDGKHTVYWTPQGLQDKLEEPNPIDERMATLSGLKENYPEIYAALTQEGKGEYALTGRMPTHPSTLAPLPGDAGKPYKGADGQWYQNMKSPETGMPVPVSLGANYQPPEKPISPYQQAMLDLKKAEDQLKTNPNSPYYKLQMEKAQTAALRARAADITAQAGAFGTVNGKPLAGAALDADGNPVGYHFQGNVKPTSTEVTRADLATSAIDQMQTMKGILTGRGDLFGPMAGRATDVTKWLGSQDPDAQRFEAAARIAADHLAGVFGGRSEGALKAIHDVIGKNKTNPAAAAAALDQMMRAADVIQKRGTRKTVGGVPGTANSSGTGAGRNSLGLTPPPGVR